MLKRAFDFTVSALALLVLSPLFLLLALAVRLDSPGPVFFRGLRVGRGGTQFRLYKFRTMVRDAAQKGPGITAAGDVRVTRVGRFLRRTKLDEFPQLINILKGDMSLVGPRPEDPRYVEHYRPDQREVLRVRPGITSPASIRYRHEEELLSGPDWEKRYIGEVMPAKLSLDLEYIRHATFWSDLKIILQTVLALFR